MLRRILLVPLVAASACAGLLPPPNGLHGGEMLYTKEDSLLLEVMGPGLHKEDHRAQSRGQPIPVIAAGATLRVAADYEQQRAAMAPNASMADRNPWILVEVVDSPVAPQDGWKGWVNLETTARQAPTVPPALPGQELPRASHLCPLADSNELACNVDLAASVKVRVLGCAGRRVEVELFAGQGAYLHGYVNPSQFPADPCATARKE
jgi:hypothetical protein